ncbi:MAG: hypothetical protein LUF30_06000, partial [Lachnospiraceae bacterium]|nr:hypothetical protein [Lachnospiraceae bacterium]
MKKIKALIVSDSMNMGGLENQLMYLLRNADKDRFQIDYVCRNPNAYYRKEIEELGGGFYTVPKMRWEKPQEYCRALYQVMRDGEYEVGLSNEHVHSGCVVRNPYKALISK